MGSLQKPSHFKLTFSGLVPSSSRSTSLCRQLSSETIELYSSPKALQLMQPTTYMKPQSRTLPCPCHFRILPVGEFAPLCKAAPSVLLVKRAQWLPCNTQKACKRNLRYEDVQVGPGCYCLSSPIHNFDRSFYLHTQFQGCNASQVLVNLMPQSKSPS